MKTVITKHPVLSFISINLFVVILIAVIFSLEYVPIQLLPGLFAILITATSGGKIGVKRLLRKTIYKKENRGWYLFALLVPIVFCLLSYINFSVIKYDKFVFPSINSLELYLLELLIIVIGSYGEEIGWRGFLLPILQKKHSLFVSSLIIGLIWGLWHLQLRYGILVFMVYLVFVTELSFIFTWINQRTGKNILSVIILHSSFNASVLFFFGQIFTSNTLSCQNVLLIYGSWAFMLIIPCFFIIKRMFFQSKKVIINNY